MRLFPAALPPARTVRAAVRLMHAGAAITALTLLISIVSLAFFGRSGAMLRLAGSSQPFWVAVTVGVAGSLIVIALWLWMARATSRGRSWARLLSTVLFGLATLGSSASARPSPSSACSSGRRPGWQASVRSGDLASRLRRVLPRNPALDADTAVSELPI